MPGKLEGVSGASYGENPMRRVEPPVGEVKPLAGAAGGRVDCTTCGTKGASGELWGLSQSRETPEGRSMEREKGPRGQSGSSGLVGIEMAVSWSRPGMPPACPWRVHHPPITPKYHLLNLDWHWYILA